MNRVIAVGIKRLTAYDALNLVIRQVQIEPLPYRYV